MNGLHPEGQTKLAIMLYLFRMMPPHVTTRALAKDIGISAATLNRIERGNAMDAATLVKLLNWMMSR